MCYSLPQSSSNHSIKSPPFRQKTDDLPTRHPTTTKKKEQQSASFRRTQQHDPNHQIEPAESTPKLNRANRLRWSLYYHFNQEWLSKTKRINALNLVDIWRLPIFSPIFIALDHSWTALSLGDSKKVTDSKRNRSKPPTISSWLASRELGKTTFIVTKFKERLKLSS